MVAACNTCSNDPTVASLILGGRRIFLTRFLSQNYEKFCNSLQPLIGCAESRMTSDAFRCQKEFDLHWLFASSGPTKAITHIVNDLMSFPFGGRYQSAALHTMEKGTPQTIQWNHTMELPCGLSPTLSSSSSSSKVIIIIKYHHHHLIH